MKKLTQAIVLGVLCLLLTIGMCVQIRTVDNNGTTISTNQKINNLKSQVLKLKEKYEESTEKIQDIQDRLEIARTSVTKNDEELKALEEQIKNNNILMGTTEVSGQGVIITLTESNVNIANLLGNGENYTIHDRDIIHVVNELLNAGAEAIQVNGQRIVGSTSITCDGNIILINGEKVGPTFEIKAIGYPARMATLKRTAGVLQYLELDGDIKTTFKEEPKITINKYNGSVVFKYASVIKE